MSSGIVLPSDRRFKNLTGQTFGKWRVFEYAGKRADHHMWLCECSCGRRVEVAGTHLRSGRSASCTSCGKITHGKSKVNDPTYGSWLGMLDRCRNPKHKHFRHYGGRGVTVCERWSSFKNFLDDMWPRPPGTSIERKDVDGNYEPSNCVWATDSVQKRNQRHRTKYEFNGDSMLLSEWAERLGIPRSVLSNRLYEGWSVERAFTTPCKRA